MDFQWTDEQQMMRKLVRCFAEKEIAPRVKQMDETDLFPRDIVTKMGRLGLMGIPLEKKWGGRGADFIAYIIAIQELSRVSAAVGVILSVHTSVGTYPILYFGSERQKQHYLPKLAAGKYLGAFALTEAQAGSDAAAIRTTAAKEGDTYVLNGSKLFVTNGGEADTYITFAVTDPEQGTKGISAFIVEKDTPGLKIGKKEGKMGLHGSSTTEIIFEQARVPEANLLGTEGMGFTIAMSNLEVGRIGIAAQSIGLAEAALECCIQRFKLAPTLDRNGSRQGTALKLADMATRLEAAKWLTYRAADLWNRGQPCGRESSMAKMMASDMAMEVTSEAVQMFGSDGYTREYPLERFFRDAKVTQIYEGTNQIQRKLISKHLLS